VGHLTARKARRRISGAKFLRFFGQNLYIQLEETRVNK
jgi:hypothetical protein